MAGQDVKCVNCETTCLDCRSQEKKKTWKPDTIEVLRSDLEKAIQLCPEDSYRELLGKYL